MCLSGFSLDRNCHVCTLLEVSSNDLFCKHVVVAACNAANFFHLNYSVVAGEISRTSTCVTTVFLEYVSYLCYVKLKYIEIIYVVKH